MTTTQPDATVLAVEVDEAWQAYMNCLKALQNTQYRLAASERTIAYRAPTVTAFEHVARHVYSWLGGNLTAEDAMKAISSEVERGRQEHEHAHKIDWGMRAA